MNTKMPKSTKSKLPPPLGKNNELQILNKQHIKNEGINNMLIFTQNLKFFLG